MSQREYFTYCYECECAGEIPLPLSEINRKPVEGQ